MTIRLCRSCGAWHDLSEPWPVRCHAHFKATIGGGSVQIIKDIEPYRAVAADKATGKAPVVGGRAQHREFLKRNGYIEVGNEVPKATRPQLDFTTGHDIKRAIEEVKARR